MAFDVNFLTMTIRGTIIDFYVIGIIIKGLVNLAVNETGLGFFFEDPVKPVKISF